MDIIREFVGCVLDLSRYYRVGLGLRALLAAMGFLTVLLSVLLLIAAIRPLYVYSGGFIQGYVGLSSYHLTAFEKPLRIPVLDSINRLVFALYLGAVLAAALVLPSIYYSFRGERLPRIALEAAAAAYIIEGLTAALSFSFIRVLLLDIVPRIPASGTVRTRYGYMVFAESKAWYTETGLYALRLLLYAPLVALVFVAVAAVLYYLIQRYYEDLLEYCLCRGHIS